MKMNLNQQQSKRYLEIVKNGNMDEMFDFGREVEIELIKSELPEEENELEHGEVNGIHVSCLACENEKWNACLNQIKSKLTK